MPSLFAACEQKDQGKAHCSGIPLKSHLDCCLGGVMGSSDESAALVHFVCRLRGKSQPILAQASDGLLYVVKFQDSLPGLNVPFNESMGLELYREMGLPVPSWRPLHVSTSFVERYAACWSGAEDARVRPKVGACVGSLFLGGNGIHLLEILPGSGLKKVENTVDFWSAWLLDTIAHHADHRKAVFRREEDGRMNAVFVDHGDMFGGPKGERWPGVEASRYLDWRVYPEVSSKLVRRLRESAERLDADRLWRRAAALPDEWKTDFALRRFEECLSNLSKRSKVEGAIGMMVNSYVKIEIDHKRHEAETRRPVLCCGHATGSAAASRVALLSI